MTDICERLRSPYPSLLGNEQVRAVLMEAADEIDLLRAQVAEGREMLNSLRIGHYYCEDSWYSCPKAEDGCANEAEGTDCNCGAEKWNARIDAYLAKTKE